MKKPSPILPYVLKRVLPASLAALVGIWICMRLIALDTVQREVHERVRVEAGKGAGTVAARLNTLMDSLRNLAANDLVINSLIDTTARENYLPPFFRSLRIPGPREVRITLTDYRGRVLTSNRLDATGLEGTKCLKTVMAGRECFSISNKGLRAVVPVRYSGLPEGAVCATYGQKQVSQMVTVSEPNAVFAVFDREGACLSASAGAPWKSRPSAAAPHAEQWIEAFVKIPGFVDLTLVCAESREQAFAALNRLDGFFLVAAAFNLLALFLAVFMSARMVAWPLAGFIRKMDRIRDVVQLDEKVVESGPEEFRRLARSFNGLTGNLARVTRGLNERIKELDCLYGISLLVESTDSLQEIFEGTLDLIPSAFRFPEMTCARIVLDGDVLVSNPNWGNQCEACNYPCISETLMVDGEPAGEIRVCYTEDRPECDEGLFLPEEKRLIKKIAQRLTGVVERLRAEERLRKTEESQAMEAGRAQMSALVLHHVGNAVTPLQVYVEELRDGAGRQSLNYLESAYGDLLSHKEGLGGYVNRDARGKQVFAYMKSVIRSLKKQDEQRETLIREMAQSVFRISEILKLQQTYAEERNDAKTREAMNQLLNDVSDRPDTEKER